MGVLLNLTTVQHSNETLAALRDAGADEQLVKKIDRGTLPGLWRRAVGGGVGSVMLDVARVLRVPRALRPPPAVWCHPRERGAVH